MCVLFFLFLFLFFILNIFFLLLFYFFFLFTFCHFIFVLPFFLFFLFITNAIAVEHGAEPAGEMGVGASDGAQGRVEGKQDGD